MTQPHLKLIEVAAAIICENDLFLITQRLKKSHLGHLWEFPGGKIEPGETIEECVVRECQEEIGVQVQVQSHFRSIEHSYPTARLKLHFLLCKIVSGIPQMIECADLRWIQKNEFKNFNFPEADFEIIEALSQ